MGIVFIDPRAETATEPLDYELSLDTTSHEGAEITIWLLANGFPDSVAFLDKVDGADLGDAGQLSDLALFAESVYLPGEARAMWIRVLTVDPDLAFARTMVLGCSAGPAG